MDRIRSFLCRITCDLSIQARRVAKPLLSPLRSAQQVEPEFSSSWVFERCEALAQWIQKCKWDFLITTWDGRTVQQARRPAVLIFAENLELLTKTNDTMYAYHASDWTEPRDLLCFYNYIYFLHKIEYWTITSSVAAIDFAWLQTGTRRTLCTRIALTCTFEISLLETCNCS